MSDVDRFFCQEEGAHAVTQWYFYAREGILGPFDTKEIAHSSLQRHIDHCREHGLNGGRTSGLDTISGMMPEPIT